MEWKSNEQGDFLPVRSGTGKKRKDGAMPETEFAIPRDGATVKNS
jgi:hypothetical protein